MANHCPLSPCVAPGAFGVVSSDIPGAALPGTRQEGTVPRRDSHNDPYLDYLDTQLDQDDGADPARKQALVTLLALQLQQSRSGFDALSAIVLAVRYHLQPPSWAMTLLANALDEAICQGVSLDAALGLRGSGRGATKRSGAQQRAKGVLHERMFLQVRKLVLAEKSLTAACKIVAKQFEKSGWNTTAYSLKAPNAKTLQKLYRQWDRTVGPTLSVLDGSFRALPEDQQDKVLKQMFGISLPK